MEELMNEVAAYAEARGIKPATVLQNAAGLSGTTWDRWASRGASCSLLTAERIRKYIAEHPAGSCTPRASEAAE